MMETCKEVRYLSKTDSDELVRVSRWGEKEKNSSS